MRPARKVNSEKMKIGPSSRLRFAERKADGLTPDPFGTFWPTPVARAPAWGCEAVATNESADAGRIDRSGRHGQNCQAKFA